MGNQRAIPAMDVPKPIVKIGPEWHGGQDSMLYAVASTGGLTINPRRQALTPADEADILSGFWSRLARELEPVVEAGDLPARWQKHAKMCSEHYGAMYDAIDGGESVNVRWRQGTNERAVWDDGAWWIGPEGGDAGPFTPAEIETMGGVFWR